MWFGILIGKSAGTFLPRYNILGFQVICILLQFSLKMTYQLAHLSALLSQCGNCNIFNQINIQNAYSFK